MMEDDKVGRPFGLRLSEGLGPLVVNGATFEPLRLPVPQIARGIPKEVHVFTHEMMVAAVAAERECWMAVMEPLLGLGMQWRPAHTSVLEDHILRQARSLVNSGPNAELRGARRDAEA
jgi:hypothetical protein